MMNPSYTAAVTISLQLHNLTKMISLQVAQASYYGAFTAFLKRQHSTAHPLTENEWATAVWMNEGDIVHSYDLIVELFHNMFPKGGWRSSWICHDPQTSTMVTGYWKQMEQAFTHYCLPPGFEKGQDYRHVLLQQQIVTRCTHQFDHVPTQSSWRKKNRIFVHHSHIQIATWSNFSGFLYNHLKKFQIWMENK